MGNRTACIIQIKKRRGFPDSLNDLRQSERWERSAGRDFYVELFLYQLCVYASFDADDYLYGGDVDL